MTEAEWLGCGDLRKMLDALGSGLSDRKSRLFAVACCRRAWHLVRVEESRRCIEAAEQFADGSIGPAELSAAIESSCRACGSASPARTQLRRQWDAIDREMTNAIGRVHRTEGGGRGGTYLAVQQTLAIERALREGQHGVGCDQRATQSQLDVFRHDEEAEQAVLLRDVFGNPFWPVALAPEWRTSTAVAVAREMYESRDFAAMPILADALQDVGCEDDNILNHCRQPRVHVRGCWVVDLVLGKD